MAVCKKPTKKSKKHVVKTPARMPLEYILRRKGNGVSFQITRQDGKLIKRGYGGAIKIEGFTFESCAFPDLNSPRFVYLRGSSKGDDQNLATFRCRTIPAAKIYVTKLRAALRAFNKHLLLPKAKKK
jgi:hypothetical protein